MAKGEANKVWLVPSDFGSALEGFTKLLGAPGSDGVFRYQPSPVDDDATAADDSAEVADWFTTRTDPAIAEAVAKAEAEARGLTPGESHGGPDALVLETGTPERVQNPPNTPPLDEPKTTGASPI